MNKSKLAFFELEAWEREYLELRLAKITDLKNCQFFS